MKILAGKTLKLNLAAHNSEIWALTGIRTTLITGTAVYSTFNSLYLYQERHISMTFVGLISLISGLLSGAFQFISGLMADRFGRRRMLLTCVILSIGLQALLTALIGFNSTIGLIIIVLIILQIIVGMGAPILSAIVADIAREGKITRSYALMQIADNIGWAIGPLVGGYLLGATSFVWLFGISTVVRALSLIFVIFFLKESHPISEARITLKSIKIVSTNYKLLWFGVIVILMCLLIGQWLSTLSVFTIDRIGLTTGQFGLLITVSGLVVIVFQYPLSSWIERMGILKALALGGLLYGAGFFLFSWIHGFDLVILAVVIASFGEIFFVPTASTVVSKISRPEDRGKNMGFFGLCWAIGLSLGPLLGGFLMDQFPKSALSVWGPMGLIGVVGSLALVVWSRLPDKKATSQVQD